MDDYFNTYKMFGGKTFVKNNYFQKYLKYKIKYLNKKL